MAALLEFECPACGGGLEFAPTSQMVRCPYCDTQITPEAMEELSNARKGDPAGNLQWQMQEDSQWQEEERIETYLCESCGGELMCDANTAATQCPYCDNPVVLSRRVEGSLRPELVIPFQLDKEAAKEALRRFMSGKPLLPKSFQSENRIDRIQGVYVPFWLFDADVEADIHYKATRVRTWSDSDYTYTSTRHYSLHRAGAVSFEAVPVDGSAKMADDLMESIEPYDLTRAVDFNTAYLAGYLADKYDVSSETTAVRANERIRSGTEQAFRQTAQSYDSVIPSGTSLQLKNSRVRYALFPVWMLTTCYRGQKYTFAMNGQTGKMVGDLPVDKGACWRWFAGIAVIASAIAYGIAILLGMGG